MYKSIVCLTTIALAVINAQALAQTNQTELSGMINQPVQSLLPFKWQNRIILIKQNVLCDDEQSQSLHDSKAAIDERHILWFLICNEEVKSNYSGTIDDQFAVNIDSEYFVRDDVSVMLVGKDGGIKRRTDSLNLDELFTLIDFMPMRQNEMRR